VTISFSNNVLHHGVSKYTSFISALRPTQSPIQWLPAFVFRG